MSSTAVAGVRQARRAPPRPRQLEPPLPFPEVVSERVALRGYREAVTRALRTLAAAEQVYVELSDGVDAHRNALAGYGFRFPLAQKRGSRR
jgi:hypothetical protein